MTALAARIAGAPISWGVSEVPGWGYQLGPDRVLPQMRDVGLSATEFGPEGFLPEDPGEKERLLQSYGLAAVGGFVPVVLHEETHDPLPVVDHVLDSFVAAGAGTLVLAAATGRAGYDERLALDAPGMGDPPHQSRSARGKGVSAWHPCDSASACRDDRRDPLPTCSVSSTGRRLRSAWTPVTC